MSHKKCTTCNKLKSVTSFYKFPRGKYGVGSVCKECTAVYTQTVEPRVHRGNCQAGTLRERMKEYGARFARVNPQC